MAILETRSTCCYCGVGCGVLIETNEGVISGVKGDPAHPANFGRLCTKGATLAQSALPTYRLQFPEHRAQRGVSGTRLSWQAAQELAAQKFAQIIREHGPNAVAFYISGQLLTEDYYVFNKLAKGLIGTNNVDTNSRLCMSSAVAGYKQTLGVDAPPCSYRDIGLADVIFITGANPAVAHPIIFRYIEEAKEKNPNLKIIVADPRRSESAEIADLHLPLKPGSDIALFNGMLHILIAEGLINESYIEAHTEGFARLAKIVAAYTPERVADMCGLDETAIYQAARWFGQANAALSMYCQGLNQSSHGTHNNAGIVHLHLATGQIGKPGAGPFSLTGQPNAMGGREVGGLSNLLSAHRDLLNPKDRAEMAQFWGVPFVPKEPGKSAIDLFKAVKAGEIKAVWIACTNPAQSLPYQAEVREALAAAEFVVLQEAYSNTDTAAYADLLLPAASWGEKAGTVTNSERCITRIHAAVPAIGEALPDWKIVVDFAHALGQALQHPATAQLFPYHDTESIFNEHRESTRGRDLDITGLSYAVLESQGPQQWPFPEGASAGTTRLYSDGRFPTPSGKARFVAIEQLPLADMPSLDYPLSLLSGRMRDQWHGMSRTGTVPRLFNLEDEPLLFMHPRDLASRGLVSGDIAKMHNGRGSISLRVQESPSLFPGRVWLPMHWGNQFMNGAGANALTPDATDPYSKQPELKHAAVQVRKLDLPYPIAVVRACANREEALVLLEKARTLLASQAHSTVGLYGRKVPLVVWRSAAAEAVSPECIAEIDALFGLDDVDNVIRYNDPSRAVHKLAAMQNGKVCGVRLAGEALAVEWLRRALSEGELSNELSRFALAPSAKAPARAGQVRKIVCKCADISEDQILAEIQKGADMDALQATLKCGTFCGGCIPEIRKLFNRSSTQNSAGKTEPALI